MPYGVSWTRYISFMTCSLASIFAGSQVVHHIYRPLDDLKELQEDAWEKRLDQK